MHKTVPLALLISAFCVSEQTLRAVECWEPAETHAVIIGVTRWEADLSKYSRKHRKDQELRDLLVQLGTPTEQISLLLDDEATLPNIRHAIESTLAATNAKSTLLVYYAGHGWRVGDDFCFANYDAVLGKKNLETIWKVSELAEMVHNKFSGKLAVFLGDCCHSGGMRLAVEKLGERNVPSFSLTSATQATTSTGNWTFTQCVLDAFSGLPLMDTNRDGTITLGELNTEVSNTMLHIEGQQSDFYASGTGSDFIISNTDERIVDSKDLKFPVGSYVRVKNRFGRIVGASGEESKEYDVAFFTYAQKKVRRYNESEMRLSKRGSKRSALEKQSDCEVKWRGQWYPARVIREANGRWFIHYVNDDDSWDEWVEANRIRFPDP